MLKRAAIFIGILFLLTLVMQSFNPGIDYYTSMQVENVGGRPYLIVQYVTTSTDDPEAPYYFSIYTPGAKGVTEWDPVSVDRLGHALGVFQVWPPAPSEPIPENPERQGEHMPVAPPAPDAAPAAKLPLLGILHGLGDSTWFDLSQRPAVSNPHHVAFDWLPLASADLNGIAYAFGMPKPDSADARAAFPLLAAQREGDNWKELKLTNPSVKVNMDVNAVTVGNSIKVFWRAAEADQPLGFEKDRYTTDGPLNFVSFNGTEFSAEPISVSGLPRGNTSFWAHDGKIRCLIQTRAKLEQSLAANGPMEIWDIDPSNGNAVKVEPIGGSHSKPGLIAFIAAQYFTWEGKEYILRSNWQMFEIWEHTADGWKMIQSNPKGLPAYDLETLLLYGLGAALGMIAFGALLAFRRRRQAWTLVRKIQAHEIYATLFSRAGAYTIDITLTIAAAMLFAKFTGTYVSPGEMLLNTLFQMPYWPFFGIYMGYLCLSEWLLGATLGKAVMGLCVVMDGGEKLSFTAAFVRNLVGFAERVPFVVVLFAFPLIMLSPRRQRLGDMLSHSFVVNKSALEMFKQQRAAELAKLRAEGKPASDAFPPADRELSDASGKDRTKLP